MKPLRTLLSRLLLVPLLVSACSSGAGGEASTQTAFAERSIGSTNGRSITAYIRDGVDDDATRDLGVSVGKMRGVETADIFYALGQIKVFLLSSATSEDENKIRDYLRSSTIVTRVE